MIWWKRFITISVDKQEMANPFKHRCASQRCLEEYFYMAMSNTRTMKQKSRSFSSCTLLSSHNLLHYCLNSYITFYLTIVYLIFKKLFCVFFFIIVLAIAVRYIWASTFCVSYMRTCLFTLIIWFFEQNQNELYFSPESLRWPFAIGLRQTSCVNNFSFLTSSWNNKANLYHF